MTTISFETWRSNFERAMRPGRPGSIALQKCIEYFRQPASRLPEWLKLLLGENPGWADDVRTSVLRLMYNMTVAAPPMRRHKKKEDAYARKALRNLTTQAESFVQHLKDTAQKDGTGERVMVAPDHHLFNTINLAPLAAVYQNAASVSRYFLELLERPPYSRKPDSIDACTGLIALLVDTIKVTERQALELAQFAMLAHGHSELELEGMRLPGKVRGGTFRKRKQANQKRRASFSARLLRDPQTKEPIQLKSIILHDDSKV